VFVFKPSHCLDSDVFLGLSTVCRVRKFPGQTELTMSAEVELISTMVEKKSWTRPPIQMEFQVCDYRCSLTPKCLS